MWLWAAVPLVLIFLHHTMQSINCDSCSKCSDHVRKFDNLDREPLMIVTDSLEMLGTALTLTRGPQNKTKKEGRGVQQHEV
jgi:hypothetical protein